MPPATLSDLVRSQVLFDNRAVKQGTILIVAQLTYPAKLAMRPFAVGKDFFGVGTERA